MHLQAAILDQILALQLTIAWAGEGNSEPPRLGWWRTDLVDIEGGGGLLQDLLRETHRWAALQSARRAATLVDERARRQMAESDAVRTLFHWGFQIDEQLEQRLRDHKQSLRKPSEALSFPVPISEDFDRRELTTAIEKLVEEIETRKVPNGRELSQVPPTPVQCARALTRALLPWADSYPMPFYRRGEAAAW